MCVQVFVVQCSAGIDYVPSDIITLDPQQTSNLTFNMHSVYTIGKINKCEGERTCTTTTFMVTTSLVSHTYFCMCAYNCAHRIIGMALETNLPHTHYKTKACVMNISCFSVKTSPATHYRLSGVCCTSIFICICHV